jgi:chromosome segregation ATPase
MKLYLPIVLALACAGLVVSIVVMKRGDEAQHETDAGAIADYSNQLDSAQIQVAFGKGTMLTLSNRLDESQSAALTFSNQLNDAESNVALDTEQITNLTRQLAGVEAENQIFGRRVMDLTNQLTGLMRQSETNLDLAGKDYALLENCLRRDVAERVVVDRKFNNPSELQAQLQYLKQHPAAVISANSIYAGLDVEVLSNAFHVIAPN